MSAATNVRLAATPPLPLPPISWADSSAKD